MQKQVSFIDYYRSYPFPGVAFSYAGQANALSKLRLFRAIGLLKILSIIPFVLNKLILISALKHTNAYRFIKDQLKKIILFQLICFPNLFGHLLENTDKSEFYSEYLEKYYPKAFVITEEYFIDKSPDEVEKGLKEVIGMLSDQTYFYFQNKQKGFKLGEYLENIKEQLSIISKFLSNAYVVNGKVSVSSFFDSIFSAKGEISEKLTSYWKNRGVNIFYDFYAFYFDYLVKFFLEGIKFRIPSQASSYNLELSRAFEKLKGSRYESEMNERLKIYKELLDLLKSKDASDDKDIS